MKVVMIMKVVMVMVLVAVKISTRKNNDDGKRNIRKENTPKKNQRKKITLP